MQPPFWLHRPNAIDDAAAHRIHRGTFRFVWQAGNATRDPLIEARTAAPIPRLDRCLSD
jgi:hypothetical protein